jgi:hypothetical protein
MGWFGSNNENIIVDNNNNSATNKNNNFLVQIIFIIIISIFVFIILNCIKYKCQKYFTKKVQQQTKLAVISENA